VAAIEPTVALVDVGLPPAGGLDSAARLGGDRSLRVVLWGYSPDPPRILAALRVNVYGFLPKTIAADALVRALSGVAAGEACLSRELTFDLIEQMRSLPVGSLPVGWQQGSPIANARSSSSSRAAAPTGRLRTSSSFPSTPSSGTFTTSWRSSASPRDKRPSPRIARR
jgi:Response regulator containing a CheY-like receiver domain and an HTH DNA-binding domain